jgi:hypothetical protein
VSHLCGLSDKAPFMCFAVCRCIYEYKDAIRRSRSRQKGVPAVVEAGSSSKVDIVKHFESYIINVALSNVNAFFISDKRGECECIFFYQACVSLKFFRSI